MRTPCTLRRRTPGFGTRRTGLWTRRIRTSRPRIGDWIIRATHSNRPATAGGDGGVDPHWRGRTAISRAHSKRPRIPPHSGPRRTFLVEMRGPASNSEILVQRRETRPRVRVVSNSGASNHPRKAVRGETTLVRTRARPGGRIRESDASNGDKVSSGDAELRRASSQVMLPPKASDRPAVMVDRTGRIPVPSNDRDGQCAARGEMKKRQTASSRPATHISDRADKAAAVETSPETSSRSPCRRGMATA